MIGATVFHAFVAPRVAGAEGRVRIVDIARRVGLGAAVALLVTVPVRVALQATNLGFEGDPWMPMVPRVFASAWGHALTWQAAAAIVAASGFYTAGRGKQHGWYHARLAVVVISLVPALSGHAGAMQFLRWAAVSADAVHVAAAGAWVGGLGILTLCAVRLSGDRDGGEIVASLIEAFHRTAKTAVITVVTTGIVSTKFNVIYWSDFIEEHYGEELLVKFALVLIALYLGWRHSKTGAALARSSGPRAVTKSLTAEWVVMVLVLLVTGLLTGSPPPGTEN